MMGLAEIGVALLLLLVIVGGVLFYVLMQQRNAVGEGEQTPSLPPKREPAPPGPDEDEDQDDGDPAPVIVELDPGVALDEQLRTHANQAEARGLRPFLEVGAIWCPPSKMFGDVLGDPRMQAALAGIYLIRVDMDAFGDDPKLRELRVTAVPVFFELDADGQATGRSITGAAWGADTIENMSAAMAKFCA